MSSFDGLALFDSGAHEFDVPETSIRFSTYEAPGSDDRRVCVLGRSGKRILQNGRLIASDRQSLENQIQAIRAVIDGRLADLIDNAGIVHASVLMVRFTPKGSVESGRDFSLAYQIEYVEG